jgi:threonine dehydratase
MMVSRQDIEDAADRIAGQVRVTPVMELEKGAFGLDSPITLKLELHQHTGSFKPRGAFNRVLSAPEVPAAGLITASGGNHGQAVAFVGRQLGYRAEIFVPETSPPLKAERMRRHGAVVNVAGTFYDDSYDLMLERAAETGALLVHAYDQPETVMGQGTLGMELASQAADLDTVLVAVGGGGVIAGVAAWYRGSTKVVSVEPEVIPTLAAALDAGRPVEVEVGGYAADSLGAKQVGDIAFEIAREFVQESVLVTDDAIRDAQATLWDSLRIMTEPGGAAALAAILSGAYRPATGERIGVIVCGGNTTKMPDPPPSPAAADR